MFSSYILYIYFCFIANCIIVLFYFILSLITMTKAHNDILFTLGGAVAALGKKLFFKTDCLPTIQHWCQPYPFLWGGGEI